MLLKNTLFLFHCWCVRRVMSSQWSFSLGEIESSEAAKKRLSGLVCGLIGLSGKPQMISLEPTCNDEWEWVWCMLTIFPNPSIYQSILSGTPCPLAVPPKRFSYLSRCFDSLPDAEVDDGEDEEQTKGQLPADGAQLVQTRWAVHLQHMTTGERSHWWGCREGKRRCSQKGKGPERMAHSLQSCTKFTPPWPLIWNHMD